MKLNTPEISWHGKEPVLSVDFCKIGSTLKFATAGADNDVKVDRRSVEFNLFSVALVQILVYIISMLSCRYGRYVLIRKAVLKLSSSRIFQDITKQ